MKNVVIAFFLICNLLDAQNYWKPLGQTQRSQGSSHYGYSLDKEAFARELSADGGRTSKKALFVQIPDYQGNIEKFSISQSEIFSPELAKKYPTIRCFVGKSLENPQKNIRFIWSDFGLNAIIEENFEYSFIEATDEKGFQYKAYLRGGEAHHFECKTIQRIEKQTENLTRRNSFQTDNQVRTYRIAIASTLQYTNFFGGKTRAFAQIASTINRLNQLFGAQLSVQFQLVSDENLLIENQNENPFTALDYDGDGWYSSASILQRFFDEKIGNANYDIGHLFHNANLGGNAGSIGCICNSNDKGRAFSAISFRAGMNFDSFDVDIFSHEVGHQLGAYHTFSYRAEGSPSQVEPGSGSTIMGYAGVTNTSDVQRGSDPYFHHRSVRDMLDVLQRKSCGTFTASANDAPQIGDLRSYTIPKGTAFLLEGTATDANGDDLLYTWEQSDSRGATYLFSPLSTSGAIARSLPPSTSSKRYIPRLSRILSGELTQTNPQIGSAWETVLNTGRTLNWSFVVTDRTPQSTPFLGNTAYTTIQVVVSNTAGPFKVTSHKTATTWYGEQFQDVTWDVAGTDASGIDVRTLTILFSTDNGTTFSHTLATQVPNTGTVRVKIPASLITENGRFMIKAEENIFLAVNEGKIKVVVDDDNDGDGFLSSIDNCPTVANADQSDLDKDGIGDTCDDDMDGDKVANTIDNCLKVANTNQADLDRDGIGDACDDDMDGDGVPNDRDNCPQMSNPDQSDLDQDGIGDVCDSDIDGDGIANANDPSQDYVLISNGFTPNDDGKNDYYTILRAENYHSNLLLVYNQLGELVYQARGYKNQWNGMGANGKKLPQGSYFYIFTLDNSETYKRQGWLFINY